MEPKLMDSPLFNAPFCSIISGPTSAGKTMWSLRFVEQAQTLIFPPPQEIIWCYTEYQKGYQPLLENPNVRMVEGLPDINELKKSADTPKLLVLDDMMLEAGHKGKGAQDILTLFIRGSHHWGCSLVIFGTKCLLSWS